MMKLKAIVPDMEKTFGTLEFAGEGETTTQRVNGVTRTTERRFHLFSSVQRADDVEVVIPGEAGERSLIMRMKLSLLIRVLRQKVLESATEDTVVISFWQMTL